MITKVKICCISTAEEAKIAIDMNASALGLVGSMPSGPGVIDDSQIREIAQLTPPAVSTFLLTSEITAENIIDHHRRTLTSTIQIVDALHDNQYIQIRNTLPAVKLVQVIHVIDENSVEEAIRVSEFTDALLLDSGNPFLAIKELGGTGRIHNWKISRKIIEKVKIPVFLAGGLNAENIRQAIDEVQPWGVDICTGVRSNSRLDPRKLEIFMNQVFSMS
jgi:phosphoribosylanthranilate isomerase